MAPFLVVGITADVRKPAPSAFQLQWLKETELPIPDGRLVATLRRPRKTTVEMVWGPGTHVDYCTRLDNILLSSCPPNLKIGSQGM